jgi:arginase
MRECRLSARIAASDGGVVVPPRYRADWDGQTVRNRDAIASYSRRLADRIVVTLDGGGFPVVLGGDCSILLGAMSALRRRGRYGLIFVDGHLDFRHLGNSPNVRAAAGEDLALVTGRGTSELVDLEGPRPYVRDTDVHALGARDADEHTDEVRAAGIGLATVSELRRIGFRGASEQAIARLQRQGVDGFWIHLDLDVVDSALLPAVDSPEPAGLSFDELRALLVPLLSSRLAVGLEVTIFDPDLDESGRQAAAVTDMLVAAFEASVRAAPLPLASRHAANRETVARPPAPPNLEET